MHSYLHHFKAFTNVLIFSVRKEMKVRLSLGICLDRKRSVTNGKIHLLIGNNKLSYIKWKSFWRKIWNKSFTSSNEVCEFKWSLIFLNNYCQKNLTYLHIHSLIISTWVNFDEEITYRYIHLCWNICHISIGYFEMEFNCALNAFVTLSWAWITENITA